MVRDARAGPALLTMRDKVRDARAGPALLTMRDGILQLLDVGGLHFPFGLGNPAHCGAELG